MVGRKPVILALIFLFASAFALSLSVPEQRTFYGKTAVFPVTVCSNEKESVEIALSGDGLSFVPANIETELFGSSTVPDCQTEEFVIKASEYGSYTLRIRAKDIEKAVRLTFLPISDPLVEINAKLTPGIYRVPIAISYECASETFISVAPEICAASCAAKAEKLPVVIYPVLKINEGLQKISLTIKTTCGDSQLTFNMDVPVVVESSKPYTVEMPAGRYSEVCIEMPSWAEGKSFTVAVNSCLTASGVVEGGKACFHAKPSCGEGYYEGSITVQGIAIPLKLEVYDNASVGAYVNVEGTTVEIIVVNPTDTEIEDVVVTIEGKTGRYTEFLGKLEPGDYDTVDYTALPGAYRFEVKYRLNGVEESFTGSFEVKATGSFGSALKWILLLAVIGFAAWKAFASRR